MGDELGEYWRKFHGGVRISIAGNENSSITIYSSDYSLEFGEQCDLYEKIIAGGGCGESASRNIFEKPDNGTLA